MKVFAIIGNPVAHSKSPLMHNFAFQSLNEKSCYTRILFENSNNFKEKLLKLRVAGVNITVPYKEIAYQQCDEVVGIAKKIGAVNTVIVKNEKLIGYNTDAPGFLEAIQKFDFKNILILGGGGTAKALSEILNERKISFAILNRSKERLEYFKKKGYLAFCWKDFINNSYDLIINTTSAGLEDRHLPAPPYLLKKIFEKARFAYDAIYGKETPFLQMAKEYNLQTQNGETLLLYQGVFAFEIFTDYQYQTNTVIQLLKKGLKLSR